MFIDPNIDNKNQLINNTQTGGAFGAAGIGADRSGQTQGADSAGSAFKVLTNANHGDVESTSALKGMFANAGSAEDIADAAGTLDADLMSKKLEVLSNIMTPEDFAELTKGGMTGMDEPIDTIVTVNDKIKMALMEAGIDVSDMGGSTPDGQMVRDAGGSAAQAAMIEQTLRRADLPATDENVTDLNNALDAAKTLTKPDEAAIKYIFDNKMELTVKDLYKAENSAAAKYMPPQQANIDFAALEDQMKQIVAESDMIDDPAAMDMAKWLVSNDIPLTSENLSTLRTIKNIDLPPDEMMVTQAAAKAIAEGRRPEDADLSGGMSDMERAVAAKQVIDNAAPEDLERIENEGKPLDIRNLADIVDITPTALNSPTTLNSPNTSGASVTPSTAGAPSAPDTSATSTVAATQTAPTTQNTAQQTVPTDLESAYSQTRYTRILTQIQLEMTVEANYTLIKQGISLETTPLEELAQKMQAAEQAFFEQMMKSAQVEASPENVSIYRNTTETISSLKSASAYALGMRSFSQTTITTLRIDSETIIETLDESAGGISAASSSDTGADGMGAGSSRGQQEAGRGLSDHAKEAMRRYETLWTAPRSDLGDSIKKAFSNVDDLLGEIDMDATDDNRRAVRILAYNSLEITVESVTEMKQADAQVQSVINGMTPQTVLQLIREGLNPLDMTISELNTEIDRIKDERGEDDTESMAEFLWKLDRRNDITAEERASYIGIYRLFSRIEKTDSAVVGALVNQGAPLTMRNLLTGIKNSRASGRMDFAVDDAFGALDEISFKGTGILEQITAAFSDGQQEEYAAAESARIRQQAAEAKELAGPNRMADLAAQNLQDMTMEQVTERMRSIEEPESRESYVNEQYERLQELLSQDTSSDDASEQDVIRLLQANDEPVTYYSMMAARRMLGSRNSLFNIGMRPQVERELDDGQMTLEEAKEAIIDRLSDSAKAPEEMAKAQETLAEAAENAARDMMPADDDLKENDLINLKLMRTELMLTSRLSRNEQYTIPVNVEGQDGTVHLQIVRSDETRGRANIVFENDVLGKVAAELNDLSDRIEGLILADTQQGLDFLKAGQEAFEQALSAINAVGGKQISLNFALQENMSLTSFQMRDLTRSIMERNDSISQDTPEYNTQTSVLYGMSKAFLTAIMRIS